MKTIYSLFLLLVLFGAAGFALAQSNPETTPEAPIPEYEVHVPAGINLRLDHSTTGKLFRPTKAGEVFLTRLAVDDGAYQWHEILRGLSDAPAGETVYLAANLAGVQVFPYSDALPKLVEAYQGKPLGGGTGCLYYTTYDRDIIGYDVASGSSLNLTSDLPREAVLADFSDDGSLILYQEFQSLALYALSTMRPDGSEKLPIIMADAFDASQLFGVFWSPDEQTIVFATNRSMNAGQEIDWISNDGQKTGHLFLNRTPYLWLYGWVDSRNQLVSVTDRGKNIIIDVPDARESLDLAESSSLFEIPMENTTIRHWSSDGDTWLIVEKIKTETGGDDDPARLYLLDASTQTLDEIASHWQIGEAKFAPDDQLIAFVYWDKPDGEPQLGLYDIPTKQEIRLSTAYTPYDHLLWQPATEAWNVCALQ